VATADQLRALLQSHFEGDAQRFYSVAMQVAAQEAKRGHGKLADDIRKMIDQAKLEHGLPKPRLAPAIPISRVGGELSNLVVASLPKQRLSDIVISAEQRFEMERIVREQKRSDDLRAHGLLPRRKILLVGPPGTGKTLTASVVAGELGLPLMQVRLDALITKFMGETAAKLRQIFDAIGQTRAVYFFDEFDAIGSQRGGNNDVGEIRRVLNSFLQMMEEDNSHSLIVCATNHPEVLDHALLRRFDDVLHYELPDAMQVQDLLVSRLGSQAKRFSNWDEIVLAAKELSYAEIVRAAEDSLKNSIIDQLSDVTEGNVISMLTARQNARKRLAKVHK
jgi:SpoVK/Ycf46/Vps4 family AAA+-type ATPase